MISTAQQLQEVLKDHKISRYYGDALRFKTDKEYDVLRLSKNRYTVHTAFTYETVFIGTLNQLITHFFNTKLS